MKLCPSVDHIILFDKIMDEEREKSWEKFEILKVKRKKKNLSNISRIVNRLLVRRHSIFFFAICLGKMVPKRNSFINIAPLEFSRLKVYYSVNGKQFYLPNTQHIQWKVCTYYLHQKIDTLYCLNRIVGFYE